MVEPKLSVLPGQCLDRRMPDKPALTDGVAVWEDSHNSSHTKADWQFTTPTPALSSRG